MTTLLTRRQVAELLSASLSTIHRLEQSGQLPAVRLRGAQSRVRYQLADVERLIEYAKEPTSRISKREAGHDE
ncbi:MAG: helix-turn-helix domain-containing protein [Mesorhizobium sp.]|uniref:helix-turn-helix transcriptional regulator n=1 Tax=Mesorhizobium sp. TaxID=1871066 RepID=UPI00122A4A58|nr:helix-turn-helix domain-containing protein [Mesorhizobium sp.]TIP00380.1 MAG: helix-turn-helix domain-containing protein [Mesorhizobium sp.]